MSKNNLAEDRPAVNPSNVESLVSKRWEKNSKERPALLKQEQTWLAHHERVRLGKNEVKPPSLDSIFARHLMLGLDGSMWACAEDEFASESCLVYRWAGTHWGVVHRGIGEGYCSTWLDNGAPSKSSQRTARDCWSFARTRLSQTNPVPAIDLRRAIVPCQDAYLEITKDGIRALAPDPELGMTHALNIASQAKHGAAYHPQPLPENSKLHKFLSRALPDPEVRALVQEQCGMTLLPGNYQMATWWYGVPGSGKSTLAEAVELMQRQVARLNLQTLGNTFALEGIIGANLIVVDENECEKYQEGTFKSLVSGNGVSINRKNLSVINYHSRAKWLLTSNQSPYFRDRSGGVARRLTIVEWKVQIPETEREQDFHKVIFEEEGQLFLDWMLEGARRIVERGRFMADHELPVAAREAKQASVHNSDSIASWVHHDRVLFGDAAGGRNAEQPITVIYERYKKWCEGQGFEAFEILTQRQFTGGLKTAGFIQGKGANRQFKGEQKAFFPCCWTGAQPELEPWVELTHVELDAMEDNSVYAAIHDQKEKEEIIKAAKRKAEQEKAERAAKATDAFWAATDRLSKELKEKAGRPGETLPVSLRGLFEPPTHKPIARPLKVIGGDSAESEAKSDNG